MTWVFDDKLPIYLQIIQILKADIARGKYQTGEKLPAVRELALTAGVNPNTMQKALAELERDGLVKASEPPVALSPMIRRRLWKYDAHWLMTKLSGWWKPFRRWATRRTIFFGCWKISGRAKVDFLFPTTRKEGLYE